MNLFGRMTFDSPRFINELTQTLVIRFFLNRIPEHLIRFIYFAYFAQRKFTATILVRVPFLGEIFESTLDYLRARSF